MISFEYAGISGGGGIGTYVRNAAAMLAGLGHEVEVFCGGNAANEWPGVKVTAVAATRETFADTVRAPFAARHKECPFDVIEGPEYGADAAGIRADWPNLPLVVRLHTPRYLIDEINHSYVSASAKLRFIAGALRRGQVPKAYWRAARGQSDLERYHTHSADLIVAPCNAILDKVGRDWGLPEDRCMVVPNVFLPSAALLTLAPDPSSRTVLFISKLEVRKGVLELAAAVPIVARSIPDVRFIMVGNSLPMPGTSRLVGDVMREIYGSASMQVQHINAVPYDEIAGLFAQAAIAVFPSVWENFPNVCLEGMAAARTVIGSSAGGMAEIIDVGRTGYLAPPRNPRALADTIVQAFRHSDRMTRMGLAARDYVLSQFSANQIGPLHEASLRRAIDNARVRSP